MNGRPRTTYVALIVVITLLEAQGQVTAYAFFTANNTGNAAAKPREGQRQCRATRRQGQPDRLEHHDQLVCDHNRSETTAQGAGLPDQRATTGDRRHGNGRDHNELPVGNRHGAQLHPNRPVDRHRWYYTVTSETAELASFREPSPRAQRRNHTSAKRRPSSCSRHSRSATWQRA